MIIYPSAVILAWVSWLTVLAGVLHDYRQLRKERRESRRQNSREKSRYACTSSHE